ncbi:MAG: hypothetical protein AB8G99_09650, partial [Planctomycetaceae bacterium]
MLCPQTLYDYDDADQLIGIDSDAQDEQAFEYDDNGNRITVTRNATAVDNYDHEE